MNEVQELLIHGKAAANEPINGIHILYNLPNNEYVILFWFTKFLLRLFLPQIAMHLLAL